MNRLLALGAVTCVAMLLTCVVVVVKITSATDALDEAITLNSREESGMMRITQRNRLTREVRERLDLRPPETIRQFVARASAVMGGAPDHAVCWVNGENEYTVEVWCRPGETPQECEDRFNEAVSLLQETFPNEGPCDE